MANLNRTTLIGRLGHDPEMHLTATGKVVANFTLATAERHKNLDGEYEEHTEWHNIVLWEKLAEIAEKHLAKGKTVYLEGRLQNRKWQDKAGNTRFTTEIIGERMQMLDGPAAAATKEV